MVGNLRNVDEDLAGHGRRRPRAAELPGRQRAGRGRRRTDLAASPALSILRNGPESFAGRKVGVLVTDGVDADAARRARRTALDEGGRAARARRADGRRRHRRATARALDASQKIDGGPSVLYDAVALLPSEAGVADARAATRGAKDFVSDAFAHCKFIGFSESAIPLLDAVGISPTADDGIGLLAANGDAVGFVERCRDLRFWDRELQLVG